MKKIIALALVLGMVIVNGSNVTAQEKIDKNVKATDLPNISLIGQLAAISNEKGSSFGVSEIELAFQHYLYPSVRADIFTAFHKEDGKTNVELEEAYLTFSDFIGVLNNDLNSGQGLGVVLGRKFVGFGKTNALHSEQWDFVDKPLVAQQFFGKDHGLAGEGAELSTLLPLPFFSQLSVGYWSLDHAEDDHHAGETEHHGVEYKDSLLNARLWNSLALTESREFEFGLSILTDNLQEKSSSKRQDLIGLDFTLNEALGGYQNLKLSAEILQAKYSEEGGSKEKQNGAYLSAYYTLDKYYKAGIRYGVLGEYADEKRKDVWSLLLVRQLTETSKFKFQVNLEEKQEPTFLIKFAFGMGPHSHVLQ